MSIISKLKLRRTRGRASHLDNVPRLPDHVDDNFYLATASRAGEIDRASGAYDEFLFSDDKLGVMPFESSVDHHLSLIEMRLKDQGRRAVLEKQEDLFELDGKISSALHEIDAFEEQSVAQLEHLAEQVSILDGEKTGRAGLYWKGSIPEVPSLWNAMLKLATPVIVFIIVGLVDLQIIALSFAHIPGFKEREAWFFTLPALGIQLVFPHLVGDRLNLIMRGIPKKRLSIFIASVLMLVWLVFAYVMTEIRMRFIVQLAIESGEELNQVTRIALYAGNLIMLVGLGTWLMVMAARSNHHQHEYVTISFYVELLKLRTASARARLVKLEAKRPVIENSLSVIESSYEDAVSASATELAEAAKSVYRRSLVNQFGAVEFTSAYLGSEASPTKKTGFKNQFKSRKKSESAKNTFAAEAEGSDDEN